MRKHKILYFSCEENRTKQFYNWAKHEKLPANCSLAEWKWEEHLSIDRLSAILIEQFHDDLNNMNVILDYSSFVGTNDNSVVWRTILQFPEVDFLFDQSDISKDNEPYKGALRIFGIDNEVNKHVAMGLHIFRRDDKMPFFFAEMDYDNLFDSTNLRWAARVKYYETQNFKLNFSKLQEWRRDNLAWVVDDEPRQSRFNGYALFASGYRVIPVHTARMLMALNGCFVEPSVKMLKPSIVIRDLDLQFPDVKKGLDYYEDGNSPTGYYHYPVLRCNQAIPNPCWGIEIEEKREEPKVNGFKEMIDYVRGYRYDKGKWYLAGKDTLFWRKRRIVPHTFIVTNGHNKLIFNKEGDDECGVHTTNGDKQLKADGIKKPISGLYLPFFKSMLYNSKKGIIRPIEKNYRCTRYQEDEQGYLIDKTRKDHNHGVPADVYNMAMEMIARADRYYDNEHYIKAAVLAQETIELLNGLHYQMMIKAYQLKCKSENAIAMDVIGADEKQLVLDAKERIRMIREDISRLVFPRYFSDESESLFNVIIKLYGRRKEEHQLLGHIFSDCRSACRNNEYYEMEAVFIREMAHVDHQDIRLKELIVRYKEYRKHQKENKKNEKTTC